MFGWFSRSNDEDVYCPKERLIYKFWNGQKVVKADPLKFYARFLDVRPTLAIDISVSQSTSKDAVKAHKNVVEKICTIFGVNQLQDGGLTEIELIELLDHFLKYCDRLKKNSKASQTPAMEMSPTSGSLSEPDQPIISGSVSGSTEQDLGTDAPAKQPSEPQLR
jgi:hypothetical protein